MLRDEVRAFLHTHGLQLRKGLGQHFLVDERVLETIVEAADIRQEDRIVEIGPGIGILTRELLKKTQYVTAIELDNRLIPLLEEFTKNYGLKTKNSLTIINNDALKVPFPDTKYKVVANIPYQITSPLLRHAFLTSPTPPTSLTLLIQKEVAEKICGREGNGLLTILVSLFGIPKMIATVPPDAFLPPPKVTSAVLHISCFPSPLANAATVERLFHLAHAAFHGKRKMLRNTIGKEPEGMSILEHAGVEPTRRPETLSIEEWIRLAS